MTVGRGLLLHTVVSRLVFGVVGIHGYGAVKHFFCVEKISALVKHAAHQKVPLGIVLIDLHGAKQTVCLLNFVLVDQTADICEGKDPVYSSLL